jgi:hypothetical protein
LSGQETVIESGVDEHFAEKNCVCVHDGGLLLGRLGGAVVAGGSGFIGSGVFNIGERDRLAPTACPYTTLVGTGREYMAASEGLSVVEAGLASKCISWAKFDCGRS